jgi:hypothetical protein
MPNIQNKSEVTNTTVASATVGSKSDKIRYFVVGRIETLSFLYIDFEPDKLNYTLRFKGSQ